jgi:hypothetical protein
MNVTVSEDNLWDKGLIFMTPYQEDQSGPYIYDKRGVGRERGPE